MRCVIAVSLAAFAATLEAAELAPETASAWNLYVELTEKRIERELDSREGFLVLLQLGTSPAVVGHEPIARGHHDLRERVGVHHDVLAEDLVLVEQERHETVDFVRSEASRLVEGHRAVGVSSWELV